MTSHFSVPTDKRQYGMALIIGASGCGKTSLETEWIDDYRDRARDVVIIDPNYQWAKRDGSIGMPPEGIETWLAKLRDKRKNARRLPKPLLLVLDDADSYLDAATRPQSVLRDLLTGNRHWRTDLIISARRTQGIPKDILAAARYLAIFQQWEAGGLQYLRSSIGADYVAQIPNQPFRYFFLDRQTQIHSVRSTTRRPGEVAADS